MCASNTPTIGLDDSTIEMVPFHVMVKPRGPLCNLACTYCHYRSKEALYPGSRFLMSREVLAAFTEQYLAANSGSQVTFTWQGGEPTLAGIPFFRVALELQEKYARSDTPIINALQTNGTLLNDKWGEFLHKHGFLVGISLDGPPGLHNICRVDRGGGPSFDAVMRGIKMLKEHKVEFNVLAAIHAKNSAYPLEVYQFLRDELGAKYIQFIPIVSRIGGAVAPYSVTPRKFGSFLISIFDEWLRHDIGKVHVQIFEEALAAWAGLPRSLCVFAETCGRCLALEHNGDLYSCDFYVDPAHKLGNILHTPLIDLVRSPQQRRFGLAKQTTLPRYCRECEYRFVCNGGCVRNRFLYTPDGEPGLNYLCEGYKMFFSHIARPAQKLLKSLRSPLQKAPISPLTKGGHNV